MIVASILWRRLDTEGHDACRLSRGDGGWTLSGHAAFVHDGAPCAVGYDVNCDESWQTIAASVRGFLDTAEISYAIERAGDAWTLNGIAQPQVQGLIDVDLGFTPATNLLAIRRLALVAGVATEAPAAYLAFPELALNRLDQTYRRLDEARYEYASPAYGYAEVLRVSPAGFVLDYPGLWTAAANAG